MNSKKKFRPSSIIVAVLVVLWFLICLTPLVFLIMSTFKQQFEMMNNGVFALPEGFYRLSDLIGCHVLNAETGELIGEVIDVLTFSSSSNFKIKETNGKTCYIPFVMKEFIETLDIEKKEITVHVIPGLL